MPDSKPPARRCCLRCPGGAAGSIRNETPRTSSPAGRPVKGVAGPLRTIVNAPDRREAERLLESAPGTWRTGHPTRAPWAEESVPKGLTVFDFPKPHRIRLRPAKGLERIDRELRRRPCVVSIFPAPRVLPAPRLGHARRTRRGADVL